MTEVEELLARFSPCREGNSLWVEVPRDQALPLWRALRERGYDYLATISAVDWPDEGVIELVYHLWSFSMRQFVHLKVRIPRDSPEMPSAYPAWGDNAAVHEREVYELFGVAFPGHPDLRPLFRDDWEGMPPFRKDFNWREYVRREFFREDREEDRGYFRD